ncbi:MAG TPA: MarR family winged helix-turn-helix transcriptional regulator [Terriglobales bacterium]|nr:MarR family winged helix-turn-helix transcriptional regulator [Terriglobales bacterium]
MGTAIARGVLAVQARLRAAGNDNRLVRPRWHKARFAVRSHPFDNSRYNEYIGNMTRGIQAEIKQTKPFRSLEEEVFVALMRTADQLAWRGAEMLKQHGLSPTQYNALRILRGAGAKGLACSEIGERMINRDPDITRLVDRLERRGLVRRRREQKDRRVITTCITPAGLEALKALDRPIEEFHRHLLGHLGESRLHSLIRLLEAARKQER